MMNAVADTMGGMGSSMSSVSLLIPILVILGIAALVKYLFSVNNRDDGHDPFLGNRWLFLSFQRSEPKYGACRLRLICIKAGPEGSDLMHPVEKADA